MKDKVNKGDTKENTLIMDDFFAPLRELSAMIDEEKERMKNEEKHLAEQAGCFLLNDPPKMVHRSTEFGHIISRKNPNLYRKVLDEIEKMAYNNNEEVQTFVVNTISIYAAYRNAEGMYSEIVSEIYSMANGTSGKIALDILRGAGALYENGSQFYSFCRAY